MRKLSAFAVILLFIGLTLAPSINGYNNSSFVNTIYVNDDNTEGPWDGTQEHPYQHIQDGINHASDGDTIFVFNGTYCENVVVDKSINLIGGDKNTTIIDGLNKDSVIEVKTESVSIENFTIRNGTNGVEDNSDKTSISHNIHHK